jgi:hypothetical protein
MTTADATNATNATHSANTASTTNTGTAADTVAPVPDSLDAALSAEWLTSALAPAFPGLRITSVARGPVVSRVSTNARFRIECADGLPPGLAADLCLKGYFGDAGAAERRAGIPEAYFYRDLAARTGVRTLHSVFATVDPATDHGVIITEDVCAAGGTFLDTESEYAPDQVADSLGELAKHHAAAWTDATLADAPWLQPRMAQTLQARGLPEITANFDGPNGTGVPHEARDPYRLIDTYRTLAGQMAVATDWTVIHGDTHIGNVFLDENARPSFLDWQLVQRGMWYIDVGYHIASALTVDDRRRCEDDLLRHYLEQLASGGVTPPDWEAARVGVRRGMVHGFFLWAITCKVAPPIIASLLHRLGTAVADHDAFASVGD